MRRYAISGLLWAAAVFLTIALAMFQRLTGPTYPKSGTLQMGSETIHYQLLRSQDTGVEIPVRIEVGPDIRGSLVWRRYPTDEPWRTVPMVRDAGALVASIDSQPPAGKVEYQIVLESESGERHAVPEDGLAVARFKGSVPTAILIVHVVAIFFSMLLATRALLEVLRRDARANVQVISAMVLLFLGGLVLGPTVQKYAFGAFWTGWPFGDDFTDNKTLVAFLAWLPATILAIRRRRLRRSVIGGWIVMMGVFLVPHSFRGSELDWSQIPAGETQSVPEP